VAQVHRPSPAAATPRPTSCGSPAPLPPPSKGERTRQALLAAAIARDANLSVADRIATQQLAGVARPDIDPDGMAEGDHHHRHLAHHVAGADRRRPHRALGGPHTRTVLVAALTAPAPRQVSGRAGARTTRRPAGS
jgi:hypothetical protein